MPAGVIAREGELGSIGEFGERVQRGAAALVFSGEPGIGKTVLWQIAVERVRDRGARVISHRAVEAESALPFAGLSDLLAGVVDEVLPALSVPRRRALEVALLLEEPGREAPDPRAIGLALLDGLRALSGSAPVVVAVDDLQWIDPSSAAAVRFALRRLRDERVGLLATVRAAPGGAVRLDFDRSLPEGAVERLSLGPLSVGALFQLLRDRLGLELSRPELVRLREATGGNPFFALELGREAGRARRDPGQPLAVPGTLRELLGERLARLPAGVREVLLTAAALGRPTLAVLVAAHGDAERVTGALEHAARAGVVEVDDARVRFTHPLLASVCCEEALPWRRRAAHALLAGAVGEEEERARHLALAAERPDAGVASALDAAVSRAIARGAPPAAAELAELAVELTPSVDAERRRRRRLTAAEAHRLAGDRERAAAILDDLLPEALPGAERADILFALARGRRDDLPTIAAHCEEALREAVDDPTRAAEILAFLSWMRLLEGRVRDALAHARAALEHAEHADDPDLLARAIARLAMAETWALEITPGLVERGVEIERRLGRPLEFHESPTVALARRLICLGQLTRARSLLEEAEAQAAAGGDEGTRGHLLFHLVMLEWFAGRWQTAVRHATTALELAEQLRDEQYRGMVLCGKSLVDAHLGHVESARAAAEEGVAIGEAVSDAMFPIWNRSVLGNLELALGNVEAAGEHLRTLPAQMLALGWNDPADNVWPDAIEVVIALRELEQARAYLEQYEERASRSGSRWALATAARCRGLLAAAEGDFDAAFEAFERALDGHERMEGRFERGRTLLALGSVRRRAKQKRAAREALEQALAIFEELGARLWLQRTREELERISGRRPGSNELTPTEQRVASLAAQGLANKQIASTLYMSVHTVEAHLSRTYRKLGVRSRAALAPRLATSGEPKVKE